MKIYNRYNLLHKQIKADYYVFAWPENPEHLVIAYLSTQGISSIIHHKTILPKNWEPMGL